MKNPLMICLLALSFSMTAFAQDNKPEINPANFLNYLVKNGENVRVQGNVEQGQSFSDVLTTAILSLATTASNDGRGHTCIRGAGAQSFLVTCHLRFQSNQQGQEGQVKAITYVSQVSHFGLPIRIFNITLN